MLGRFPLLGISTDKDCLLYCIRYPDLYSHNESVHHLTDAEKPGTSCYCKTWCGLLANVGLG